VRDRQAVFGVTPRRDLLLWGASGHAKVLNELAQRTGWRVVLLVDNRAISSPFVDTPLVVGVEALDAWLVERTQGRAISGAVAVGGGKGADRITLLDLLASRNLLLPQLVHPAAFVALDATVGEGSQVLANASICSQAHLGRGVIVNTAASVDHDTRLDDGVHIGPGAHLAGEITVERCAFVGAGAIVLPRLVIGANSVVGAGAVVTQDVPAGAVVVGNPARIKGLDHADRSR
jgi:sugar O-acyltransferase (sialic acid O-acetyltransferase NeuD family)